MVIKLNKTFKQLLMISLITIPLLLGIFGNSVNDQQGFSVSANNLEQNSIEQIPNFQNIIAKSFDKGVFNNETAINVTREITVNSWGYTKIVDLISISSNETSFDEFTYSLTPEFYTNLQYIEAQVTNENISLQATKNVVMTNDLVEITFSFNETSNEGKVTTIEITSGVSDLVSKLKDSMSEDLEIMPLRLSGFNFFPWLSIPMTSFEFSMGMDSPDVEKNVNSTNYLPAENTFDLTSSIVTKGNKLVRSYSKLINFPEFNYSLLTEYSNKENNEYLPAFSQLTRGIFTKPASIDYSTQFAPIEYLNFDVTIEIDEWGRVQNREKISLKNNGIDGQTIDGQGGSNSFPVFINANDVINLDVNDGFTNLSVTDISQNPSPRLLKKSSWPGFGAETINGTEITITPRSKIEAGSVYTFELIYEVPVETRLHEISGFLSPEWNITTPTSSMFFWTVRNMDLTIIFPTFASVSFQDETWGMSITSANMTSAPGFLGISKPALKLQLNDFSYFDNKIETIKMGLPLIIGPFWDVIQFTLLFAILGLILIVLRSLSQVYSSVAITTTTGEQIPYDLIKDFVINYEEKTALRTRLVELEKRRKNLKKVEYTKLRQTLVNKQNGNDRALVIVNSDLVKRGSRYKETIRSIELAEAEREQALETIKDLDVRRKQARIRPEIYNKLKEDQSKKLKRSNSSIERVLVELRSLLTEKIN